MERRQFEFSAQARKPANVSLDIALVAEAKRLGVNISHAWEVGLNEQIAKERGWLWKEEKAAAMASSNSFVEQRGLPLGRHRQF